MSLQENGLRAHIKSTLNNAMLEKKERCVATLRLILAAIKDRDIATRDLTNNDGQNDGIGDDAIIDLLQTLVKQRRESIEMYEKGNRQELADIEQEEIDIIQKFLPKQMNDDEIEQAVSGVIADINAQNLRDMGKIMANLREHYNGVMDFAKASGFAKEKLSA